MTEALFYHLTETPLEAALPTLLERSVSRGWRVRVECGSAERVTALNTRLWTYHDESFLPHGSAGAGHEAQQPILLSAEVGNENEANVLMLVDGATRDVSALDVFQKVCLIFDGNDPAAVDAARGEWKKVKDAGMDAKYWAQDDGRWVQKA